MTPITAEHKVYAIKARIRKVALEINPDVVGSYYGYYFLSMLLDIDGLVNIGGHRLPMADKEKVYDAFLEAYARVPDARRLAKDAIPGDKIMKRYRQEHAEMVAANRWAINKMAAASGLA